MKKAVLTVAAAGVVAAGIAAGLLIWKRGAGAEATPIARFVPAETVFLAELPDYPATQTRWQQTGLWKILHEPEVQAFLERPLSKIPKNGAWNESLEHFRRAQPHRAFLAVTGLIDNMPHVVGGFAFSGPEEEVKALVARAKAQAQAASPTGKSELTAYKNFEIESFSDRGITVAGVFAHGWYFVGNNVELLESTLDRFAAAKEEGTLAGAAVYKKSVSHLPANPDFRFFGQPAAFFEKILAFSSAAGQSVDPQQAEELRKIQAFAGATRFEGERVRDTLFTLRSGGDPRPLLSKGTLSLTSPDTLFYYAFAPLIPANLQTPSNNASTPAVTGLFGGLHTMLAGLEQNGLKLDDFKAAFGPEFAVVSDWPATSVQPTLALATEVKDAALARKFVGTAAEKWPNREEAGVTYWTLPPLGESLSLAPVLALGEKHLVLGLTEAAVKTAMARAKAGDGKTLEKSAVFTEALSTVAKPGSALAYLDSRALFERVYGWLRPMAMMWANFVPHASDYVDVARLPATETISKHLVPTILSSSRTDDGIFLESTGTVTLYQGTTVLAAAGTAIAIPILQGKVPIPGFTPPSLNLPAPAAPVPPVAPTPEPSPVPSTTGT